MKIFALNLCLAFEVGQESPVQPAQFISWKAAEAIIAKAAIVNDYEWAVEVPANGAGVDLVFDLQAAEVWREASGTWRWLFADEVQRQDFLLRFFDRFKAVDAAGGLVLNEREEALFILNRGKWSLPKGHVEKQETPKTAAWREVIEETGLIEVAVQQEISPTWHTFEKKPGKWVLKKTYWYRMHANSGQEMAPQQDEYIEEVRWICREQWQKALFPTYPLTRLVLESHWLTLPGQQMI